ncbi:MAG TPA: universal stress protein, partial [Polaromonas sp.]
DLIVVGTHGRRGLGRVLLGSGAEQIVRLAPVPVLVVRSQESESTPRAGA